MARDATVRTVLTANDQASGPVKQFAATLRGVKAETADLNDSMALLGGGIAGIAAAAGVSAFAQLGAQVADLSRQAEQFSLVKESFDQLATGVGQSSDRMLDSMRNASAGMINDQDLVLAANRAMMLGVADSSAEMAQLLEVAAVRGRAMGLSTGQAFNDLVTGLGRMSPLILDNLGIVTGGEKVFTDYAASLGKAADALTDAERKQALFNKVLSQTDTSGEIVVSQFERMDAAIQNAKMALGELFSPAAAAIAQQLADAVNGTLALQEQPAAISALADLRKQLQDATNEWLNLKHAQEEVASLPFVKSGDVGFAEGREAWDGPPPEALAPDTSKIDAAKKKMDELGQSVQGLEDRMKLYASGMSELDPKLDRINALQADAASSARFFAEAERLVAGDAAFMSGALGRAGAAVDTIRSKFLQAAAAGMSASLAFSEFSKFKGLEDQAQQIQAGLSNLGFYDSEQIAWYVDLNTQSAIGNADGMIDKFEEMNTAANKAASQGVTTLQKALSDLQGRALSAVEEATQLDVGLNPEDFLPREDAVNENARRLAAIMRDGITNQPWLEEFKNEVPAVFKEISESADPKAAAAKIMQDFQAGLRPELLDLGALKEQIKNEIAGEAAMQATAAQITAELVADTGGDSADIQAKVAKALGLGVEQTDITGGILGDINSATFNSQLVTAATGAGKGWGNAFRTTVGSNVPAELVNLLVNLVTPGVASNLNQTATQTTPADSVYDLHH